MRSNAASPARLYGLDFLRAFAAFWVVMYHYPVPSNWWAFRVLRHFGWTGVDLFFVLSGYLIAGQVFKAMKQGEPISLRLFYAKRFLRTLPNYYAVLGIAIVVTYWRGTGGSALHSVKYLLFGQNFDAVIGYLSVSWSLCVEEHFYLVFPLLVLVLRSVRSRGFVWLVIGIIAGGIVLRTVIWFHLPILRQLSGHVLMPAGDPRIPLAWGSYLQYLYRPTYARLDALTLGVALAALRCFRRDLWDRGLTRPNLLLLGGAVTLCAALAILSLRLSLPGVVLGFPLLALGYALMMMSATHAQSWLCRVHFPGIRAGALLSYAVYLTHEWALALAADISGHTHAPSWVQVLTSAVFVLGFATLLYFAVERPFMKIRERLSAPDTKKPVKTASQEVPATA